MRTFQDFSHQLLSSDGHPSSRRYIERDASGQEIASPADPPLLVVAGSFTLALAILGTLALLLRLVGTHTVRDSGANERRLLTRIAFFLLSALHHIPRLAPLHRTDHHQPRCVYCLWGLSSPSATINRVLGHRRFLSSGAHRGGSPTPRRHPYFVVSDTRYRSHGKARESCRCVDGFIGIVCLGSVANK